MSIDEQKKFIQQNMEKRKQLQNRIRKLNEERKKYIAEQEKKNVNEITLGKAILNTVRKQPQSKKYTFVK